MTITVKLLPTTGTRRPGSVEVSGLPWNGPGSGYEIIEDAIGARQQSVVQYAIGSFSVGRHYAQRLVVELAERFGRVHVVQFGGSTVCD